MGSEKVHQTPESRRAFAVMIAISVVAAVLGVILGLIIDWFPKAASREAEKVDTVWDVLVIASVPVFVLVQAVVLYCVYKFRMKPGEEGKDGPPIHGNTRIEIVWTTIPALLLLALCAFSYVTLVDIEEEAAASEEQVIRVVGEQFTWTFYYPPAQRGGKEIVSNRLYLPAGKRIKFDVQSKDVIHDFWVPAFRMKIDAVPGITTHYRITPKKLRNDDRDETHPVVCAELCGLGHAAMRQTAIVMTQQKFDDWLEKQRNPPAPAESPGGEGGGQASVDEGRATFVEAGCNGCHTLADAGATGNTGPNLDEVLQGASAEDLRTDIADPSAEITQGFPDVMPKDYAQQLGETKIDSLVMYLQEVTK